jgi:hypothetical protein
MQILIMSSNRVARQITWNGLPAAIQARTTILTPFGQEAAYRAAGYPNVRSTPDGCFGLPKRRQWVLEQAVGKVVMLDDDLAFSVRRTDDPTKFRHPPTEEEFSALFVELENALDSYVHAGVAIRQGANRRSDPSYEVGRMIRVLAYDAPRARAVARFDRVDCCVEDLDYGLQLLRAGLPNLIINHAVQDQVGGTNAPGGYADYRTVERHCRAVEQLAALHPGLVRVETKSSKASWGGADRLDSTIAWQEAYAEGLVAQRQNALF